MGFGAQNRKPPVLHLPRMAVRTLGAFRLVMHGFGLLVHRLRVRALGLRQAPVDAGFGGAPEGVDVGHVRAFLELGVHLVPELRVVERPALERGLAAGERVRAPVVEVSAGRIRLEHLVPGIGRVDGGRRRGDVARRGVAPRSVVVDQPEGLRRARRVAGLRVLVPPDVEEEARVGREGDRREQEDDAEDGGDVEGLGAGGAQADLGGVADVAVTRRVGNRRARSVAKNKEN